MLKKNSNGNVFWEFVSAYIRNKNKVAVKCTDSNGERYCLYKYTVNKGFFKEPYLALARGLVANTTREAFSAVPFPKFFNLGEVAQTVDPSKTGFVATEKMDGTLIVLWRDHTGELRANTRGLLWDYAVVCGKSECYTKHELGKVINPFITRFFDTVKEMGLWHELESLVRDGTTVMFELVNKRYPASKVEMLDIIGTDTGWVPYFLAIRDNRTFALTYPRPDSTPFPTPRRLNGTLPEIVDRVRKWRDKEGAVLYYPGRYYDSRFLWWNYLVKVKSRSYIIYGVVSGDTISWRKVARLAISGAGDDLRALFRDNQEIVKFVTLVEDYVAKVVELATKAKEENKSVSVRPLAKILRSEEDAEKAVKVFLSNTLPRKKDNILSYLRRIVNRLERDVNS